MVGEQGAGRFRNGPPAVITANSGHSIVYAHFGEFPCGNVSEVCLFTHAPCGPSLVMALVRAEVLPLIGLVLVFAVKVFHGLAKGVELEVSGDFKLADFKP